MQALTQAKLFESNEAASQAKSDSKVDAYKTAVSGTFSASRREPIHRWFRYSAGFSSIWASQVITDKQPQHVLDPFVGSGTVCVVSDLHGVASTGVEAHPFVARLAQAKISWTADIRQFQNAANEIAAAAKASKKSAKDVPELLVKCYAPHVLDKLFALKDAYEDVTRPLTADIQGLLFLAISSILRPVSHVGTAQWQYILPAKTKAKSADAFEAFAAQVHAMSADMAATQKTKITSVARIINSDARELDGVANNSIDLVITSPPYANNYDYADATRLEMTFWGEVSNWGDLHNAARKYLVRSSSQHVSKDRLNLDVLLADSLLQPIQQELVLVCRELERVKETKGGKKSYDLMLAAYYTDMARTFIALRRVVRAGGEMCWVVGDSAPYGVHAPADRWLGELALAAGFKSWTFEKLRDRNIKWKNRKHRVPLHEGRLWIKG